MLRYGVVLIAYGALALLAAGNDWPEPPSAVPGPVELEVEEHPSTALEPRTARPAARKVVRPRVSRRPPKVAPVGAARVRTAVQPVAWRPTQPASLAPESPGGEGTGGTKRPVTIAPRRSVGSGPAPRERPAAPVEAPAAPPPPVTTPPVTSVPEPQDDDEEPGQDDPEEPTERADDD